jgi:hypothetical protein
MYARWTMQQDLRSPNFVQQTSNSLYELHVWLLLEITREALRLFFFLYGSDDVVVTAAAKHFVFLLELIKEAGFTVSD